MDNGRWDIAAAWLGVKYALVVGDGVAIPDPIFLHPIEVKGTTETSCLAIDWFTGHRWVRA